MHKRSPNLTLATTVTLGSLFLSVSTLAHWPEAEVSSPAPTKASAPAQIVETATPAPRTTKPSRSKPKMLITLRGKEKISDTQLFRLLTEVGFKGEGHKIAFALVMRESGGRPLAHNQNSSTGDNSYGLFQINMIGDLGPRRLEVFGLDSYSDLFDPVTNAQAAYYMSKGTNFGSWGIGPDAYRSGAGISTIAKWYDDYEAVKRKVKELE